MAEETREITEILDQLRQMLPLLHERYHIASLEVIGSYVRSQQSRASDLDILVTFTQIPGLLTYMTLENDLSDRLGVKVDLVMRDALNPAIRENILKEAVLV